MKRSVIITIAGTSSRFSKSIGNEVHKAIFSDDDSNWTTLSCQLNLVKNISDEIIIVTGYQHSEITNYLNKNFGDLPIKTVYNEHYSDYGSCYSLILGIRAANENFDELIFLEGDLVFDAISFNKLIEVQKDVITSNNILIDARTAVIFYVNDKKQIRYVYDTAQNSLKIDEPFLVMGNSGQVWKFIDIKRLKDNLQNYGVEEYKGTNLVPINDYYKKINFEDLEVVTFKEWFNCNTIEDYILMKKYAKKEHLNG